MLKFLFKEIPYNFSFKRQFLIGALLGGVVIFVMFFLQPFDTNRIESNHKKLIFSGFGLILFLVYLFCARIENLWYYKNKVWNIKYEIFSFVSLVIISSVVIHFYNQVFLNDLFDYQYTIYEYLKHGLWFFQYCCIPIMLIVLPFYLFLRNNLGELITQESLSEIEFSGLNNGEKIILQKDRILFVKASENYVKIFYTNNDAVQHETFRNTLTAINNQAPFLFKSHRSYLVNITAINSVIGNSQNAKIQFHLHDIDIPLSKSYYKSIKLALVN